LRARSKRIKVGHGRGLEAARPGQAAQPLLVILAGVPAHQTAQRRIGLRGRGIDTDPPGRHQIVLARDLQDETEHGVVNFQRQPRAGHAERGVVGHALALDQPQEAMQRQRVGAAPFDLALRIQPLELADEQHPEVPSGRNRQAAPVLVGRLAEHLDRLVELRLGQDLVAPVVECTGRRMHRS
jgi:hypothetical protein